MATKMLESVAISAFCDSTAIMHAAGIQIDESMLLLAESVESDELRSACDAVYSTLSQGKAFSVALNSAGVFPQYCIDMIAAGERSGRLENVLRSLAKYYDEEARLYAKIRSAISYPAILLCVMSVILLFTVGVILPVFFNVYDSLAGNLVASSFGYVGVSAALGWIALIITLVSTIVVLIARAAAKTTSGRDKLIGFFEKFPATRAALRRMAISKFTAALATYVSAGINMDEAVKQSIALVRHEDLKAELLRVQEDMTDPEKGLSLAQAINEHEVFEPIYARMLTVASRTGSLEEVLSNLSDTFFEDSLIELDNLIDGVEPTLAAFLTVSVGATLIAVMLPLIGIMGSMG